MLDSQHIIPATRLEKKPTFDLRFPPLPRTVTEVSKLVSQNGDVADTPRLTEIVHADPMVAASVLRRINSAYYSVRRRVSDIGRGVFLLGFEEVCDIVMTSGMMKLRDILHSEEQLVIFERVMRSSVGAAGYMKKLAVHLELEHQESAFALGLLHTVGRLVLLYNRPDDYEALWFTNDAGVAPTVTSEQIIFGTDHAELGAMAADTWNLPESMVKVIRFYLTPGHLDDPELRRLALALSVAATATERLCRHGVEAEKATFEPTPALHTLVKMSDVTQDEIIDVVVSNWEEVNRYVSNMVGDQATAEPS